LGQLIPAVFVCMFTMVIKKVTSCGKNILKIFTEVNCKILTYWETF
jgi:hypothetical protein